MSRKPNINLRLAVKSSTWNPTQREWKHSAQCVQIEEKDRIGKFIFKRDAKSAMVGRLLLRYAVSKLLNVPYRCLKFDRTDRGKPILLSPVDKMTKRCDLNFNLSHQGDYVVFAADPNRLVGVDVMKVEWTRKGPISELFRHMDRQLTDNEWVEVKKGAQDMDQLKTFYRFWCLKESLVKALGTGIGFEVGRLNFKFKNRDLKDSQIETGTTVDVDRIASGEWRFEETLLEDHCVAVAQKLTSEDSSSEIDAIPFKILDVQELLAGCEPLLGNDPDQEYWEQFSSRQEDPSHR